MWYLFDFVCFTCVFLGPLDFLNVSYIWIILKLKDLNWKGAFPIKVAPQFEIVFNSNNDN